MENINRRDFLRYSTLAAAYAGLSSVSFPFAPALAAEGENIAYLPATEQIKRFKAGTLSPVDVLKAQIE